MVTIRTRSFSVHPVRNVAIGVCLLVLVACSREQQDWRSAEGADTIQAYGRFIEHHPESELVKAARVRIAQLGEDQDWARAGSADTVEAYREFIAQHPEGRWAQEARIRIQNFSLAEQMAPATGHPAVIQASAAAAAAAPAGPSIAPAVSTAAGPPPAVTQPPAATQPAAAVQPPAAPPAAPQGEFGIQLGAFSNEAAAANHWRALTTRFGHELAGLQEHIVAADTPSGRVYRLQARVGAEAQARAICDSLHLHAQACVAVLPH